jgi:two-component system sensor histidine kinase KdpD
LCGDVSEVCADPELLRLALSQLLDNATKYSASPHSAIDIELERREDWVIVSVWNSGTPIPDGERELVFERYYRGSEVRDGIPGSGLGLHVARRIAIAHGGDIVYDAVTGSRPAVVFRIQIPAG